MKDIKFRCFDFESGEMCIVTQIRLPNKGKHGDNITGIVTMQYTGRKDTTHTEIYEGDILRTEVLVNVKETNTKKLKSVYGTVEYCEDKAAYLFICQDYEVLLSSFPSKDLLVFGNKYENSELLSEV